MDQYKARNVHIELRRKQTIEDPFGRDLVSSGKAST